MESRAPPPPETSGQSRAAERPGLTRRELDLLYEEALYTTVNRAGVTSGEYVTNEGELFRYLQEVFKVGPGEHEVILQRVKEAKRASYALKVSVMEGKNLLAKDANGYSDPYCMLGILLGQSPKETEEKKERKFSFRKKKDKFEKRSSVREVLPARYIQVTEVKPETLNPVWNEHFVFEIDDVYSDQLHLDIWDHDDDVSVSEACKKLNEISGFKGMGRYFKQIAKSVRANGTAGAAVEENVDDFLGCLNISIHEIPVAGVDRWFKLEPRSSTSSVQGECRLILKLTTTQRDTVLSKKDSYMPVHEMLLCQILEYEHAQVGTEPYSWSGDLSKPAWTVLSHHAVQTDLSPLQQAIIQWQSYSKHHQVQSMDYSFLLELLRSIEDKWDPAALHRELEQSLAESFSVFTEYCLALLKRMREVFPVTSTSAITRFDFLLRCLGQIHSMQAFKSVCPFRNELHVEITAVVKRSTLEWYEATVSSFKPEDSTLEAQLRILVQVVDAVHVDVHRSQNVYNKLFISTVKVDYYSITYRQLEKLAADDVSAAMERVCGTLEQEGTKMTQTMGETLFELYITLKALKQYREFLPLKDAKALALCGFHEWFKTSIHKWLQIVHEKSCDRIRKAVEVDKLEHVDALSKHSSSAVDVTTCFNQVKEFWVQLAWPDSAGAFIFVTRLTADVCSAAVCYSELIKRKIERRQHGQENKHLTNQLCIALNNIEHVRKFLRNLPQGMDWKSLEVAMQESCGPEGKEQVQKTLNAQLLSIDVDLQREVKRMIAHLTDKAADDVSAAMERVCGTLEQEGTKMTQTMGETLFELYITLKALKQYREFLPLKDAKALALCGFHEWFKTSIHKWLQIVHEKSCDRIRKAVEVDKLEHVDALSKHSSSAVDVTTCFNQVKEFWVQLAWPDSAGAFIFVTRLTALCIALNNIEHVRKFLRNLPQGMDWKSLEVAMQESCGPEGKEQVQKTLNAQLLSIDVDLQREVKRMIAHLTDKAVSPLMKYLDDTLVILSESLVKENLDRVLQGLWTLLLKLILDTVAENRGVSVEFYGRFYYTAKALVEFFHAEGDGLPVEDLRNEDYKALEEELRLNKCSSNELIEQYYLEKIGQQKTLKQTKFGRISVKCYYEASEQKLYVEILHAADLIALDTNGLSDPFVIIELCPQHWFPTAKSQRTQVKNKTLHPVFDELFHFQVTPAQYKKRFACIVFTVMDYDWLSTNDFAGEAICRLSDFCGPDKPSVPGGVKNVQPLILHLARPKPSEKPILKMLEARTSDREAQEFVKKLKEIEKSMGEGD
ncbi:UNVERIFIED_CONTAM: hypothetical protein FKN15_034849 [Acipenser sinensis]